MVDKIKVVLSAAWYPLCIARYFLSALERDERIDVKFVGPFTGADIPWKPGMKLPEKYVRIPDVPLSRNMIGNTRVHPGIVERQLGWDKVDLWINADSNFCFTRPEIADHVVTLGVDPHVLSYDFQRTQCDQFYSMQAAYTKPGDKILYYAASEEFHYPEDREKIYDVALVGLQYENRTKLVNRLRSKGLKVFYEIGAVYDEYRMIYNQSRLAISWSSLDDLIARVFESLAMQIPLVTNRVSDLENHFEDGKHLYIFDNLDQAEARVHMALANYDDALQTAHNGYRKVVGGYLYKHRIEQILQDFELNCRYGV